VPTVITPMQPYSSIEEIDALALPGSANPALIVLRLYGPAGTQPSALQVLTLNAAGQYVDTASQVFHANVPTFIGGRNAIVADFNGDGLPDLFVADQGLDGMPFPGGQNRLFLATPDGHLTDATSDLPAQMTFSHRATAGVVDASGHLDLFLSNVYSVPQTPPELLLNDGAGSFSVATGQLPASIATTNPAYTSAALADLNGDGLADLVLGPEDLSNPSSLPPVAYINPGSGNFSGVAPIALPVPTLDATAGLFGSAQVGPTILDIEPIHISSSKFCDLLVVSTNGNYSGYQLQVLINDGSGHFTDQTATRLPPDAAAAVNSSVTGPSFWIKRTVVADLNGDGLDDFVTQSGGDQSAPSRVFLNDGTGHFIVAKTLAPGTSIMTVTKIDGLVTLVEETLSTQSVTLDQIGGEKHLSASDAAFQADFGNDDIYLYGSLPAGTSPSTSQASTYQTTITVRANGAISNGVAPTLHLYANGVDLGAQTLQATPSGYVNANGTAFTTDQTLAFNFSGFVPLDQLKIAFDSLISVGLAENSSAFVSAVTVNGVALSADTYYPASSSALQQTISTTGGTADLWDGGYMLVSPAEWNTALATRAIGTVVQPIAVQGGPGADTVHVLGRPSDYTFSASGSGVRLSETAGLEQNALLSGVRYVSFVDGATMDLSTGRWSAHGTAASMATSLDDLQPLAAAGSLGRIDVSDASTSPIEITDVQSVADAQAIALIAEPSRLSIVVTAGQHAVHGGAGIDTALFTGASSNYTLSAQNGGWAISDAAGDQDSLTGVERLHFSDSSLALDLGGNAGSVARVLGAVFGAQAVSNQAYVGIGLGLIDGGESESDVMQLALNVRLGAQASHGAIVDLLYQNVVGSVPSAADHDYYTGLLDAGLATPVSLGMLAASTSLNAARIDLVGLAAHGLAYVPG
jgi:hypothetical protein